MTAAQHGGGGDFEFSGTARFQIVRRLGAGGMGVVYEAFDRERRCRVALKTVPTLEAEALLRLKNEFRSLQGLEHPNLVTLGELIEAEGRWFFTMELVHGVNFLQWVRGGAATTDADSEAVTGIEVSPDAATFEVGLASAPVRPAAAIPGPVDESRLRAALAQLSCGLQALHEAGKVHRDIKPSNILVTTSGRVVLLDFGLVTGTDRSDQSSALHPVGTFEYMAPEQAASKRVGPEADWYSVGVVLYQALTGRVPFSGAPLEVMISKQQQDPVPPRALVPTVAADLDRLCVDLLRFDPRDRPGDAEVMRRVGATPVAGPASTGSFTQAPPFVGRTTELQALRSAFDETRQGRGLTVLVQGESGIGKTTLCRRFTEDLRLTWPDAVVLAGRCDEREAVPYKGIDGVVDALSRYMTRLPEDRAAALLPRAAALLGRAFPVLRRVRAVAEAPLLPAQATMAPHEQRARLFAAMRELMGRLADRAPVVVVIDDFQWVDADSMALLAELLRTPDAPALLLVATMRSGAPVRGGGRPSVTALLPGEVRQLRLGCLPPEEARELARLLLRRSTASPGTAAEAIAAEANGHPLFIDELVRYAALHPAPAGALTMDEAVQARVTSLPETARRVLELVAVAGASLPQEAVARATGLAPATFARAVAVLRVGNLVQTTGVREADTVGVYHDRVRGAVLAPLDEAARQASHRELALALEACGSADARVLADQWAGAGDVDRAATYTSEAAVEAERGLAFARAADLYRAAAQLRPDHPATAALRVKTADALAKAGRCAAAAETYLEAAAAASPEDALELQRRAAENFLHSGHVDEGLATIREVLAVVGLKLPRTPRRALLTALGRRVLIRLRGLRWRERHESQVPQATLGRIDICWAVASTLGMIDSMYGVDFNGRTLLMALRAGEPGRLILALANETIYSAFGGHRARRRTARLLAATDALAHRLDVPRGHAWAAAARGMGDFLAGRFPAARTQLAVAEELYRDHCAGSTWEIDTVGTFGLYASYYAGHLAEVGRRVPQLLAEAEDRGDLYAATHLRLASLNTIWLAADDPEEAERHAAEAAGRWSRSGEVQHYAHLMAQVQIALYRGPGRAARELVARRWGELRRALLLRVELVRVEALHLRARAALAAATPRGLAEAAALGRRLARERAAWAAPLADLVLAGVAGRRGDLGAARRRLQKAAAGFDVAGMPLHAAVARRRDGILAGGDEGATLVTAADAVLAAQQIVRPDRWAAMIAPGFDDT